ncbi:carboxypeptidase-like regulatory domain-containing protein [Sphingobacterium kyonggiense]
MNFYQIMGAMKCTMVLLTCLIFQVSAHSKAQNITINRQSTTIIEILKEIRKQSHYDFVHDGNVFDGMPKVKIAVKDASVEEVLNKTFEGLPLSYSLKGTIITIRRMGELNTLKSNQASVKVSGRVIDQKTGLPLSAVSIRVKGSATAVNSDAKGEFSILIPGSGATLVFSFQGYQTHEIRVSKAISNLEIKLQERTERIEEVEVTVLARRKANTNIAVLEERKKASIVQDAISAELIEKTASITTTQALQRVTGVTVTDDRYVAIRGLGDRSVIGQLNGVRLASSDPDRSAIPLDLVPASLLDNITVYKTVTPDKPADAASGIVELKTKSVPDKMTLEFIGQTGTNSNIGIGGQYNSFWNSEMGVLGNRINKKNLSQDFQNLAMQYPNGLSGIHKMAASSQFNPEVGQEVNRINGIMRAFDPVLTTEFQKAPLNQLYSLTFGNSYDVFENHKLGVILGGNYFRRTTNVYQGDLTQYSIYQGVVTGNKDVQSARNIPNYITPNSLHMGKYQTYKENTGSETLNYGMLSGLTYRFNPLHEISFQYIGSWGGESKASHLMGAYEYTGLPGEVSSTTFSLKQSRRTLNTFNFQGEHKLLKNKYSPRLSYNIAHSNSTHNDPDFRFVNLVSYKPRGGGWFTKPRRLVGGGLTEEQTYSEHLYALGSGYVNGYGSYGIIQAEPNGRRWRNLNEDNYNYKADLAFPVNLFGKDQEFKFGGNYLFRERSFSENHLFLPGSNFTANKQLALYENHGNLNRLVGSDVIGILAPQANRGEGSGPVSGFLYNSQKSPNNYTGYFETAAFYGMANLQVTNSLKLVGGVRFEMTDIGSIVDTAGVFLDPALTTSTGNNTISLVNIEPNSVYKEKYMPFYSVNAIYTLNDNMNFRLAFNSTLARPELREITNVFEFDAFQMGLVVGNPNLRNQQTKNLDFRWEWFPQAGEVIAISAFGKQIDNQLVKVFDLKTEGLAASYMEFPTIQFQNDPNRRRVYGLELELVKNLGLIAEPLNRFFIGSNLLLAQSEIKKTTDRYNANRSLDRFTPKNSPLFEQAPYSINTWLNFNHEKWGTDITSTFNMVGERLIQINLTGEPDLYSRPVPVLDFVFSQRLSNRLLFKGYAKNVLNPDINTVYSNPKTGGKWYKNEYINRSFKNGTEIMLGFTYNIL